jgi:hypothetical protein
MRRISQGPLDGERVEAQFCALFVAIAATMLHARSGAHCFRGKWKSKGVWQAQCNWRFPDYFHSPAGRQLSPVFTLF